MSKRYLITVLLLIMLILSSCGVSAMDDSPDGLSITVVSSDDLYEENADITDTDENSSEISDFSDTIIYKNSKFTLKAPLYYLILSKAADHLIDIYGIELSDCSDTEIIPDTGEIIRISKYLEQYSVNEIKWICLIYNQFFASKKDISESINYEEALSNAQNDYYTNLDRYKNIGVGIEELITYYLYVPLYDELFSIYYAPGGANEIPEEDLSDIMETNVIRFRYTYLPFYDDETMEMLSEDDIDFLTELNEEYYERYNSGEAFDDILLENLAFFSGNSLSTGNYSLDHYVSLDDSYDDDIASFAYQLEENTADILNTEEFASVIVRLPVNEIKDSVWLSKALDEAYKGSYGEEFSQILSDLFLSQKYSFEDDFYDLNFDNYLILIQSANRNTSEAK